MKILSTGEVLGRLGYDYFSFSEEPSMPELAEVTFGDLLPQLMDSGDGEVRKLAARKLYRHQLETLRALKGGRNAVLVSGTGSGKTEAWATYALERGFKVLVIPPTLALSQDQVERLARYYAALGMGDAVAKVDAKEIEEKGEDAVRNRVSRARLVVTNPAFLMEEVKRAAAQRAGVLGDFLRDVDLAVIDELDFYGSRRATLLLALVELLQAYVFRKRPQLIVLTATLGNPEELAQYLARINGRETEVIRGRPFKVPNHVYLILGKNLDRIWQAIRDRLPEVEAKVPEVLPLISDFETFREHAFDVVEALKAGGIEVPEPAFDIAEVLAEYVRGGEDCVTLVFTPSIRTAEKLARRLREKLKELGLPEDVVATHHHRIGKERRREIEEGARRGEVKVIFTPRTLQQGIDIGTICRVVHYGLPEDVRDFKQREGRKGRREDLPFSETVIVPARPRDRMLVELGEKGLGEYVSLPLENLYINPRNKCVLLFKALFKLLKDPEGLDEEEKRLAEELQLAETREGLLGPYTSLSERGSKIWKYFHFYEFGPPYKLRICVKKGEGLECLPDDVSRRDFVEYLQPGCIDPVTDLVISGVEQALIIEEDVEDAAEHDFVEEAVGQYELIKRGWGERPDIRRDIERGRLTSEVSLHVRIPRRGFGELVEQPWEVLWIVESRRPRVVRYGDGYRTVQESKAISLDFPRGYQPPYYIDFTYGYIRELDPGEDTMAIRMGLAALKVALRLSDYRISMRELGYFVEDRPRKLLGIWEVDCGGILETMDWSAVRRFLDGFTPPKLYEWLLWMADEWIAPMIIAKNVQWDKLKEYALRVVDYLQGLWRLKVMDLRERVVKDVVVPRPSRDLKLVAIDITPLDGDKYLVTLYDGEEYIQSEVILGGKNMTLDPKLLAAVDRYLAEEFRFLIYGQRRELERLAETSYAFRMLLKSDAVVDVHQLARKELGTVAPLEELGELILPDLKRGITALELRELSNKRRYREAAKAYGRENARMIYLLYLVLTELRKGQQGSSGDAR